MQKSVKLNQIIKLKINFMTKVSIIIATYNSSYSITESIRSLLSQDHKNIEYNIIDGKSTDDTLVKVAKLENEANLKFKIISETDKGIYDALNKGVNLSDGDVVGFLHSDDILANKSVIAKIVKVFEDEDVDGVYGDLQYVTKDNTNKVVRKWKSSEFKIDLLKKGWMPAHPTLFLKKEVYQKHGQFDLSFIIAGDYEFMLRVFKDNSLSFRYLPIVITRMRLGGISNRSFSNILQKMKEDYRAIKINKIGGLMTLIQKNTSKIRQFF